MIKLQPNSDEAEVHFHLLKKHIKDRAQNISNGWIGRGAIRPTLNDNIADFLGQLQFDGFIHNLLTMLPEELPDFIDRYNADFYVEGTAENDVLILQNLFINSIYNIPAKFNKLNFIKKINIDTCPYCNRSYIYYLSGTTNLTIKPALDHFYPKTKYPYLALSFFNLIPSCSVCNGLEAKGEKDPILYHLTNPYLLAENAFEFSYDPDNYNVLNPLIGQAGVKVKFTKKIDGHNNVFKLEELYNLHADHVGELIVKSKGRYAEAYRRYLASYSGMTFSEDDINRMILGNYAAIKDIHRRPLAKLYQDIGRELGLIPKIE